MSWIFQEFGEINHYNPKIHQGTQPVRVIHHMLTYMFINTHKNFFADLQKQIADKKLNSELNLAFGEEPIKVHNNKYRTPRVNHETKQIELHETFLSFLWCSVYSIYVRYIETIDYPRVNKESGKVVKVISQENIEKAKEVFDYAKYLIVDFLPWDKAKLPNPEIYRAEKRDYVEQTNLFYTEAVKFILCHEFTHLKKHVEQINEETTESHYLNFEAEADNDAIDMMKKAISYSEHPLAVAHRLAIETGIVFGFVSMFFFSSTTEGVRHPNMEDRLTNALERLNLADDHFAWGIACVGLQMWDEQFGHNFIWTEKIISYKEQYYDIIQQIKNPKN
ncbi:MAG: hypothetical protein GXC72_04535 [Chitinophagaceae bacterium]|nr:hypothetical protein [Chitinophagaceae bacterium]